MSPTHRALLLDAGGTLLQTARPVAETYAHFARQLGHSASAPDIHARFGQAFATPWEGLRYDGDGKPFWRHVVRTSTGIHDEALLDGLYEHYRQPDAWTVAPGARECLRACRQAGVRTGVVSNWDLRLRPLLDALELGPLLDVIAISAEVGTEKPDPALVRFALRDLQIAPDQAVLVGDSDEDARAARGAGCAHWRMPGDVGGFPTVQARILGD